MIIESKYDINAVNDEYLILRFVGILFFCSQRLVNFFGKNRHLPHTQSNACTQFGDVIKMEGPELSKDFIAFCAHNISQAKKQRRFKSKINVVIGYGWHTELHFMHTNERTNGRTNEMGTEKKYR